MEKIQANMIVLYLYKNNIRTCLFTHVLLYFLRKACQMYMYHTVLVSSTGSPLKSHKTGEPGIFSHMICMGNHMDLSAIWEKLHEL